MALGLSRHGVRSVLIEKNKRTSERSKAPAIHMRTLEIFVQWGILDRFLAAGTLKRVVGLHFGAAREQPFLTIDFSDLEGEAAPAGLTVLE